MLVCFIIFTLLGFYIMYYIFDHPGTDGYVRMPRILIAIPILGILGIILALANLLSNKKGLRIDAEGFTLNAGMNKFGPVKWTEVTGFTKKRYMMNDFIVVMLENPAAFLQTRKGFNKQIYSENAKSHGSPMVINTTQLKGTTDEVLAELNKRIGHK